MPPSPPPQTTADPRGNGNLTCWSPDTHTGGGCWVFPNGIVPTHTVVSRLIRPLNNVTPIPIAPIYKVLLLAVEVLYIQFIFLF